jgi:hypothetical protein
MVCGSGLEVVGLGEPCGAMYSLKVCDDGARCVDPEWANPGTYDGPGTCELDSSPSLGDACIKSEQCPLGLECRDERCLVKPIYPKAACD